MKLYIAIISLLVLVSCKENKNITMPKNTTYSFYVGTYTENTKSMGIYKYELQYDGNLKQIGLAAESINPSFLTKSADNKFLLAVSETNIDSVGYVESYLIKGDSLLLLSRSSSGGAHPCFVAVNQEGFVLVANYTGGNVGLLKLNSTGELSSLLDVQKHYGRGVDIRQDEPHAHSSWFDSGNSIVSVDLGTNDLWFSSLDTEQQKLLPSHPNTLKMDRGAGPRHLAFHPNKKWVYVINELTSTVGILKKSDTGLYKKGDTISTLPLEYTDANTCADIHISSDGKFLYASNRGHNSIAVFGIDIKSGLLNLLGHESSRGDGPRNFSLSPNDEFLLVANQLTNNIVSFKRDKITGLLKYISQTEAPTPVCILF